MIDTKVTTRRASEIVGIGYEGLRSYLKRGLLKNTGMLIKSQSRDTPAEIQDAKRWSWQSFQLGDLCAFRLAKVLMDAGVPFEVARDIASDDQLWQWFWSPPDDHERFVVTSTRLGKGWAEYRLDQLATDLPAAWGDNDDALILVSLTRIRNKVVAALKGDEVAST